MEIATGSKFKLKEGQPLVSIIIPTFNRAHLIGETLDSIIAQTYTHWECIVVDDGSTDGTEKLMAEYIAKDARFHYHHRPKDRLPGGNAARNYGFEVSKGDFIKWFDSDDIMCSDFIQKQVDVLVENTHIDFCSCLGKMFENEIDNANTLLSPEILKSDNAIYNLIIGKLYFITSSSLWRKSFLINKELFDVNIFRGQEADFNFRRLVEGAKFIYLNEVLFYLRRGHQSIESKAKNNPQSVQSQFDYYQKIFDFLNIDKELLAVEKVNDLKKYVIYRQMVYFSQLQSLMGSSANFKNYKLISNNLINSNVGLFNLIRSFLGISVILMFNKGYKMIHIKSLDIRTN